MSYYFIAKIRIHDEQGYQRYLEKAGEVFRRFRGRYLAVDEDPLVLEGEWNHSRCVLISFEKKSDFENWYHSKEYREILQHRLESADCDTLLVRGLDE